MNDQQIANILQLYKKQQLSKIEDFLISEIAEDNLSETIDFVVANDKTKITDFKDELYKGNNYKGIFLDGNQYLIFSSEGKVMIIDALSESHGISHADTRVEFDETNFIKLITNKKEALKCIENYKMIR